MNIASLIFRPDRRLVALTSLHSFNRPSLSFGNSSLISRRMHCFSVSFPCLRPPGNIHNLSPRRRTRSTRPFFDATSFEDFAIAVQHYTKLSPEITRSSKKRSQRRVSVGAQYEEVPRRNRKGYGRRSSSPPSRRPRLASGSTRLKSRCDLPGSALTWQQPPGGLLAGQAKRIWKCSSCPHQGQTLDSQEMLLPGGRREQS